MPHLQLVPMLQRMTKKEQEAFWCGLYVVMGEELELGPPCSYVQLEEVVRRVPWGPAVEPAQDGPPLSPLGLGPMEVDGAKHEPEDGTTAEDATGQQEDSLPS